jgi:hypothetical protein
MYMDSRRLLVWRKKTLLVAVGVAISLLIIFSVGSFGWPMASDCRPHGRLTYFGAPAPVGTRLQAKIGDQIVADTAVTVAGWYAISIPPDNPQTTACDGWDPHDVITIWVGGHQAQQAFLAFEGGRPIDIVVSAIALDVKRSTWGKIKALFR